MGPRRCRRGRTTACATWRGDCSRFNGAASLPTRKAILSSTADDRKSTASMGPRRCRRGRRRWGRPPGCGSPGFNGAASLPTRKAVGAGTRITGDVVGLQWGRVVADAEGGKELHICLSVRSLQWGRVVADAEGRRRRSSTSARPSSFNGAASLPTRKATAAPRAPDRSTSGFNGAASLPTRKAFAHATHSAYWLGLQWGRVVADAEGRNGTPPDRHPPSGFNGAASLPTRKGSASRCER